jgi:hypothetical protein
MLFFCKLQAVVLIAWVSDFYFLIKQLSITTSAKTLKNNERIENECNR